MAKKEMKKRKLTTNPSSPTPKKLKNPNTPKPITAPSTTPPPHESNSSDSDSDSDLTPEEIQNLLEPFSKPQLIALIADHALSDSSLLSKIHSLADADVSHRKLFVHGLTWDTTRDDLVQFFSPFGEVEDCNLVTDRVTGRAKGYAFVIYKSRESASKALRNPRMKIKNRDICFQLASTGPPGSGMSSGVGNVGNSVSERKIYVSNVGVDVNVERLRTFFEKFGEIESGPLGFDVETGKCKGYALFVYKSVEGARKALEEPSKVFDGRQLSCSKAIEGKNKSGSSGDAGITTAVMPVSFPLQGQQQQQSLLGMQNMALLNPNVNAAAAAAMGLLNVNQLYGGGMIGNSSISGLSGLTNLNAYGSGQGGGSGAPVIGQGGLMGYGPYGGLMGGFSLGTLETARSLGAEATARSLGAYGIGSGGVMGGFGSTPPMLHGLQKAYPGMQNNKTAPSASAPGSGAI